MTPNRIQFLTYWLTTALCLEKFPLAEVAEVEELCSTILQAVVDRQTKSGTTELATYEEAMLDQRIVECWNTSGISEHVPEEEVEEVTRWLIGLGGTIYLQDTLYWMRTLEETVRLYALINPDDEEGKQCLAALTKCRQGILVQDQLENIEPIKLAAHDNFQRVHAKVNARPAP